MKNRPLELGKGSFGWGAQILTALLVFGLAALCVAPEIADARAEEKYQRHNLDYGISLAVPASWNIDLKEDTGKNVRPTEMKILFAATPSPQNRNIAITIGVFETNPITQSNIPAAEIQAALEQDFYKPLSELPSDSEITLSARYPGRLEAFGDLRAYVSVCELTYKQHGTSKITSWFVPTPDYTIDIITSCNVNLSAEEEETVRKIISSIKIKPIRGLAYAGAGASADRGSLHAAEISRPEKTPSPRKNLYGDLYYGMTVGELPPARMAVLSEPRKGFFPAGTESFAGTTWNMILCFKDDHKLSYVTLVIVNDNPANSPQLFSKIRYKLNSMGFTIARYKNNGVLFYSLSDKDISKGVKENSLVFLAVDQAELEKIMQERRISREEALSIYPDDAHRIMGRFEKDFISLDFE